MISKKILVVGLGYKGLSLALYLADRFKKCKVIGYDINRSLLNRLRRCEVDFAETKIRQYLRRYLNRGFVLQNSLGDEKFDIIFICVGAQLIRNAISFDNLINAIRTVTKNLARDSILVIRKNLPVGFTRRLVISLLKEENINIPVVFAPERTNKEAALTELGLQPQLIGADSDLHFAKARQKLECLFPSLVPLKTLEEAELTILCNHFHSYWLYSYGNVMSEICGSLNLDTHEIINAANKDFTNRFDLKVSFRPRVHKPGYIGGRGLNIDLILLLESLKDHKQAAEAIRMLKKHNESLPHKIIKQCESILKKRSVRIKTAKIGIAGFGYKGSPPTSDYRFSFAAALLNILKEKGFTNNISVHDPVISKDKIQAFGVQYCKGLNECMKGSSILFLASDHGFYRKIGPKMWHKYIAAMKPPRIIFDSCGLIDFKEISKKCIRRSL